MVFLGPSLPLQDAQVILRATYRPPVQKGDVYALLTSGARRIVIIDGIFHSGPSVWQREILTAMDEGIEVLGASSMGALRAAELHAFGMIGMGAVFAQYRDGVLDGDDEVALHHSIADLGYRALSVPLVNLRMTLARAREARLVTSDEELALVTELKRTHYPERSYRRMLESSLVRAWPAARRDALRTWIGDHAVDAKAADARAVLAYCAATPVGDAGLPGERVDPWNLEFRHVALSYRRLVHGRRTLAWTDLKRGLRKARPRWSAMLARVEARWRLTEQARRRGIVCPAPVVDAYAARWRRERQVRDVGAWCRARGLTRREHAELLAHHAHAAWLRASKVSLEAAEPLGSWIDLELAAIHEAQLTMPLAALFAIGGRA
ncbi:MAG: hypothetical protein K8W52_36095 [Deltaproteobacteria bacterium]|nr:hypothetical protein [Deltaproteobacteria bacterium]